LHDYVDSYAESPQLGRCRDIVCGGSRGARHNELIARQQQA
jgi:hypothetical protein